MLSVPFANKLEIVSKLVDIVLAETLFAVIILVLNVPFANKFEIVSKLVEIVFAEILLAVIVPLLIVLTLILVVVNPPLGEKPPDKLKDKKEAFPA